MFGGGGIMLGGGGIIFGGGSIPPVEGGGN